jgi:hypothetical protein
MRTPAAIRSAVETYLAGWNATLTPAIKFDGKYRRILAPHRLYRFMGEHVAGKVDLRLVKPAGWRCFIRATEDKIITLDVFEDEDRFAFRLHMGSMPELWLKAIRSARRRQRSTGVSYSMRTLVAPAVHLSCLWFSAPRGKEQFFTIEWEPAGETARQWMTRAAWEAAVGRATTQGSILWQKAAKGRRRRSAVNVTMKKR